MTEDNKTQKDVSKSVLSYFVISYACISIETIFVNLSIKMEITFFHCRFQTIGTDD